MGFPMVKPMKQYNRHASMQDTRRELCAEEEGAYVQERLDAKHVHEVLVQEYMHDYSLSELMDMIGYGCEDEPAIVEAYERLSAELDRQYREENEDKLWDFYRTYIEGKAASDIEPEDWDWFSDYHKDVYGFRPHFLSL